MSESDAYYDDYPKEPIGGGNPYYRCAHCHRSVPAINGDLDGHDSWCEYRIAKSAALGADSNPTYEGNI